MTQPGLQLRAQTIALTGAHGLMGRVLLPKLVATGAQVHSLSRTTTASTENITSVLGDMQDAASFASLLQGATSLVHLAGIAHTDLTSDEERSHARAINVDASVALFAAAKHAGVKQAVYMSSAHVYTGQQGVGLTEQSPATGDSFYGQLKLEAEEKIRALEDDSFRVVIFRPCLTYGPGVRYNLHALMGAVRRGLYVHPGGHDPLRSFVSAGTVAEAVRYALQSESMRGTFNLADRVPIQLSTWVNQIAEMLHVRKPVSVPYPLLVAVAFAGTLCRALKLPAPLTLQSLHKLTTPFTLNTDALAATGFAWPDDFSGYQRGMVEAFLQSTSTKTASNSTEPTR